MSLIDNLTYENENDRDPVLSCQKSGNPGQLNRHQVSLNNDLRLILMLSSYEDSDASSPSVNDHQIQMPKLKFGLNSGGVQKRTILLRLQESYWWRLSTEF